MKNNAVRLFVLLGWVIPALCQEPHATIRVEVTASGTPVSDAAVTVNAVALRSDREGVALATVSPGEVRVSVTKNGYFPANASITADAAREFVVRVEMQPQEEVKEESKSTPRGTTCEFKTLRSTSRPYSVKRSRKR
jgi:uncharacterized membrane protein